MQKIIHWLPLVVCVTGAIIISHAVLKDKAKKREHKQQVSFEQPDAMAPEDALMSTGDQSIAKLVFDHPDALDDAKVDQPLTGGKFTDLSGRPARMSERTPSKENRKIPVQTVTSLNTNTPLYVKRFAYLKQADVRDPDSPQNRATVRQLMRMRNQRIAGLPEKVDY